MVGTQHWTSNAVSHTSLATHTHKKSCTIFLQLCSFFFVLVVVVAVVFLIFTSSYSSCLVSFHCFTLSESTITAACAAAMTWTQWPFVLNWIKAIFATISMVIRWQTEYAINIARRRFCVNRKRRERETCAVQKLPMDKETYVDRIASYRLNFAGCHVVVWVGAVGAKFYIFGSLKSVFHMCSQKKKKKV